MSNLCNKCNVTIKITANTFLTECSHCLQLICQDCNDIPIKIAKVIQGNSDIGVTWKCISCRLNCIPLNLSTIDEKLKQIQESICEIKNKSSETDKPLWSSIVKTSLIEHKKETDNTEQDTFFRESNHIIHGVDNSNDPKVFVNELISEQLKLTIIPLSIKRIGITTYDATKNTKNTKNLIRIRYKCISDKEIVSKSLNLLKDAPNKFKSITIADDLTLEQQNNRRKLIKEANELNEKEKETESDIKHVVRYNRYSKNHFIKC